MSEQTRRARHLLDQLRRLVASNPCQVGEYRDKTPRASGVYLISEPPAGHLYVGTSTGKSNHLRARIGQHIPTVLPSQPRKGSAATLAERIARESIGTPLTGGALYADPTFRNELSRLCPRIEAMELRIIEITDRANVFRLESFAKYVLQPVYQPMLR